jgi:hypothetical protein
MARYGGILVAGGPTNTVNTATSTIATLDVSAPSFSASPNNVGFYVEGILVGKETTSNDVVSCRVSRSFKNIAGTLTALGAGVANISPMAGDASIVASVPLLNVSGTTVQLQATGVAATTIEWTGYLIFYGGQFTG